LTVLKRRKRTAMSPVVVALDPRLSQGRTEPALVDIIDFKWLMAAEGHRVHVERLQADATYARQCLALAGASRTDALRDVARRLLALIA
jgi:hypothetical protein